MARNREETPDYRNQIRRSWSAPAYSTPSSCRWSPAPRTISSAASIRTTIPTRFSKSVTDQESSTTSHLDLMSSVSASQARNRASTRVSLSGRHRAVAGGAPAAGEEEQAGAEEREGGGFGDEQEVDGHVLLA